ncbi:uncharacterized protein LOC119635541 isoform X1 [Glossina fuscipes]|uniref:Uncharacterized protein LOC119635541 isoform X1 n=1 Tax=Glossina fuscipes TaxID=7396 RepID=A0A9C5YVQ4_9MUSC|nr:uncharacterized protein LOC119635541 isoform X1 [Glossina fuscipes]
MVQHSAYSSLSFLILCFAYLAFSNALIVPQELPSILSLIYSNIPPIKKGTDSRLGFGFRLGEHADFQILLELGPQKETRPLGDQDSTDGSAFNKRHVNKKQQEDILREKSITEKRPATWLEKWTKESENKNTDGTRHSQILPQKPVLPDKVMKQLKMLHKMATA